MLLDVRGLRAGYGPSWVLHGIDFAVAEGGITTLLGANGAGKTTTLRAVCGMIRTEGEITLAGTRIQGRATEDIVRLGVAHVPDGRGTFMELTVEENLRLGAFTRYDKNVEADFETVFGYFPRLKQRIRQQAGTLSGGEQQMLAIARALLLRPKLLLLDEPSFGLAPLIVKDVFRIVTSMKAEGISVLIVEQNVRMTLEIADTAYVLDHGVVVHHGPAAALAADEALIQSLAGASAEEWDLDKA